MKNKANANYKTLIAEESDNEPKLMYLSFANDEKGWLGSIVTMAKGPAHAMDKVTDELNINPGGAVLIAPVKPEHESLFPPGYRDRLLGMKDFEELEKLNAPQGMHQPWMN